MRSGCVAAAIVGALGSRAFATGIPVGGFLPMVGIGLTDEYSHNNAFDYTFFVVDGEESTLEGGTFLGAGGAPRYDLALLDTGAAVSLLTTSATAAFALGDSYPERSQGFEGGNTITIGGATGTLQALINDPLGLYAGGVQGRAPGSPFVMPSASMKAQLNTSLITVPPESDLPNVLGLPFASQYSTHVLNSQPQIFNFDGQTVRTPGIEFHQRGGGGRQNTPYLKEMDVIPGTSFLTPPFYFPDLGGSEDFTDDPSQPTVIQGGLFFDVNVSDQGSHLTGEQFFFDTGADVSVVSRTSAAALGFDVLSDTPEFTVAVVGSGGTKLEVPGFFADTLTIPTVLGHPELKLEFHNVPLLVLNVTNPGSPGQVVPGIIGTNVFSGRDLVIDPDPSDGSGNQGPEFYISDPVTTAANWSSAAASASWHTGGSWNIANVPGVLHIANVRHVSGGHQETVVAANATAWEVNVSGASASQTMTLRLQTGVTLTTFAGLNVEQHGHLALGDGVLDVQYVDVRAGGRLSGAGSILTGSGPVPGQVENVSGVVAPGAGVGVLTIEGRYSNGAAGTLEIEIIGSAPSQFDVLSVDGPAALAGTLTVLLPGASPFIPALGASFTILSASDGIGGAFDLTNLPTLPAGRAWGLRYEETDLLLRVTLPGDFDADFDVDAADLPVWKAGMGTRFSGADLLAWQRNLGSSISPIAAVPEPTGALLLAIAIVGAGARRKRRG